ncbi:LOW QUALITY PROTEIN: hypothetical protein QC761_710705 [Podospora bellae-mahoneyi]|uniref:DUF6546 domain-containing protein n=1 Tax=Podospora bellae-mahoneyi TaxID=2093777 RepID=A0ABR0F8T0_9PEZI|nr:LOW QUALITY PROTEIN: hypothetical protein QC761_710705 [Podospora bellae-mahoneyi]
MTRALLLLLDILSRWERKDALDHDQVPKGMSLEISIQSPSDSQHWFQHLFSLRECHPYNPFPQGSGSRNDLATGSFSIKHNTDETHCIRNGALRYLDCPDGAILRLCGKLLDLNYRIVPRHGTRRKRKTFPRIEIVTGLAFRRQCHRKLSSNVVSKVITESFVCLEDMRKLKKLVKTGFPSTLRRLSIFKDFDRRHESFTRPSRLALGRVLNKASRELEVLAEAEVFFENPPKLRYRPKLSPQWPNFRRLALTTAELHPEKLNSTITGSLNYPCKRWMPKLKILEIGNSGEWTEEKGHACIFRYTFNERDGPIVTWSSTWPAEKELVLSPDLIQRWQVITSHTGHQLKVKRKPLVGVGLERPYQLSCLHVAVVPWLFLRKDILSGVSKFQLISELHSRFRDRELC